MVQNLAPHEKKSTNTSCAFCHSSVHRPSSILKTRSKRPTCKGRMCRHGSVNYKPPLFIPLCLVSTEKHADFWKFTFSKKCHNLPFFSQPGNLNSYVRPFLPFFCNLLLVLLPIASGIPALMGHDKKDSFCMRG